MTPLGHSKGHPPFRTTAGCCLLVVFLWMFSSPCAYAQSVPEIEINTSVLEELGRSQSVVNLIPPSAPALARPPQDSRPDTPGLIGHPVEAAGAPADTSIPQSFPVEIRISSESLDPASEKAVPLPVRKTATAIAPAPEKIKKKEKKTAPARPKKVVHKPEKKIPAPDPEIATLPDLKRVSVPLPPHRPDIQRVSPEFVAEARRKNGLPPLYKVAGKAGPSMPAVPKGRVYAEPLNLDDIEPAAGDEDDLLSGLAIPDRERILETLKSISSGRPDLPPPLPPSAYGKSVIVKAVMPPRNDALVSSERGDTLAMIEPSAPASAPRDLDFVTVDFPVGTVVPNDDVRAVLNGHILPLLKKNPGWHLRIHAFANAAGKTDNGDARRLSLSRALSVRSYLLDKGVSSRRLEIQALGTETSRVQLDRVDLILFDPFQTAQR